MDFRGRRREEWGKGWEGVRDEGKRVMKSVPGKEKSRNGGRRKGDGRVVD